MTKSCKSLPGSSDNREFIDASQGFCNIARLIHRFAEQFFQGCFDTAAAGQAEPPGIASPSFS
jgi:hypothetical protein